MKIAMLVSGGVDSSVALRLLQEQGHEVTAYYLKIWLEDELAYLGSCPWEEDLAFVKAVCEQANIPLKVVNLQDAYWNKVVAYALNEIKSGRTPNPDIMCNTHIKFGVFFDYVISDVDYVASGHYAQIERTQDSIKLVVSPDAIKDQTYFLSHMKQEQLEKVLFPIGHLNKSQVRELAHRYDLPNKDRKDSQGICFLGKIKFSDFIKHHFGELPGDMIEVETGTKMGTHPGFYFYTIGQRQGLGLAGGPWYVVRKDPVKNIVYISRNYYADDKVRNEFTITHVNWINDPITEKKELSVKLRHGAKLYKCTVTPQDNNYHIHLNEHDQGIAAGQFAALYEGNVCLGSGIIE